MIHVSNPDPLYHQVNMSERKSSYAASSSSSTSGEGQGLDPQPAEKSPSGAKRRGSRSRTSSAHITVGVDEWLTSLTRAASRAGTRSVSTLTPAQLQRKRANDREAQRAIRQRNKEHIETLERRIEELSVDNVDAATLVQLRQRVRELEDELSKAKENLAASRIHQTSSHLAWHARSNGDLVSQHGFSHALTIPNRSGNYAETSQYSGSSASFPDVHSLAVADSEESKDFIVNDDQTLRKRASIVVSKYLAKSFSERAWATSPIAVDQTATTNYVSNQYSQQAGGFYPGVYSQSVATTSFLNQPSLHAYEIPLRYAPPTNIVDNLLISVVQTQRRQILEGTSSAVATSPQLGALLKTKVHSSTATEPISQQLSRLICDYSIPMRLAESAACFYVMHKLLQWQIRPTSETYNAVPEWARPRACQLVTPHPVWASYIAFPALREKIIGNLDLYGNQEFINTFLTSLDVNWRYGDNEIIMTVSGEARVTPMFDKHAISFENWSLKDTFTQRYPELRECYRSSDVFMGGHSEVQNVQQSQQ